MKKFRKFLSLIIILGLGSTWILQSCNKKPKETKYTFEIQKVKHSFLAAYKYAVENHDEAVENMRNKANQFNNVPIIGFFGQLRESWIASWRSYQLMKPFSLMSEGINSPINFNIDRVENIGFNLHFLDSTLAQPNSGIVYDQVNYPTIDYSSVSLVHSNVTSNKTVGYQVAEFLLWGDDNSVTIGGTRTHYDFNSVNSTRIRRRSLMTNSINNLRYEFSDYYSSNFENLILTSSNDDFLRFLFSGLLDFLDNDLINDALLKPYNSQNKDDELSRFSENTNNDIQTRLSTIELILNGEGMDGESNSYYLIDLIGKVNPELKEQISSEMFECKSLANSIIGNFDNAIVSSSERPKILDLYQKLQSISTNLKTVLTEMGISL